MKISDSLAGDRYSKNNAFVLPERNGNAGKGRPLSKPMRIAIEQLSGVDMSDVRVHDDSALPEEINARAFAYGTDIYLAPGAEDTLAHEAWHVVQQKQRRVTATSRIMGLRQNHDARLEIESDVLSKISIRFAQTISQHTRKVIVQKVPPPIPVVQCWLRLTQDPNLGERQWSTVTPVQEQLNHYYELTQTNTPGLTYVLKKLLKKNLTYNTLADLVADRDRFRKPIFGYQHERAMRRLMTGQTPLRNAYIQRRDTHVENERLAHVERYREARGRTPLWDDSKVSKKISDFVKANPPDYLHWQPKTSFKLLKSARRIQKAHRPLVQWAKGMIPNLIGANCWESVLYAGTRANLYTEDYVLWAIKELTVEKYLKYVLGYGYTLNDAIADSQQRNPAPVNGGDFIAPVRVADNEDVPTFLDAIFAHPEYHATDWDQGSREVNGQRFPPMPAVIPRGQIVVMTTGTHVALSTGKRFPNRQNVAINAFGRQGHGILECDRDETAAGFYPTIRETTIEDRMAEMPGYAYEIHTGWLTDNYQRNDLKVKYSKSLKNSGGRGVYIFNKTIFPVDLYGHFLPCDDF